MSSSALPLVDSGRLFALGRLIHRFCFVVSLVIVVPSLGYAVPGTTGSSRSDSSSSGHGLGISYWGPVFAPSDSNSKVFYPAKTPLWETAVTVPYTFITLPLYVLKLGLRQTVLYMEEKRLVNTIEQLIGPQRGPFGVSMTFQAGGLSGFGVGLTVTHERFLGSDSRFKLRWKSTVRHDHRATVGIHFFQHNPTSFMLAAGYRLRPNARYFGLGHSAAEDLETFHSQEVGWGGLSIRTRVLPNIDLDGLALYSGVGAFAPKNHDDLPVGDRHPLPEGYGERSEGMTVGLSLIRDTTTNDGWVVDGGIQRLKASYFFASTRRDVDFWTLRGEFQRFVPLLFSQQVLALRGHATWIETDSPERLPFQRLLTNDDPDLLRGYRDFRWRDRGITALTIEYRWPLWANRNADDVGLSGYVFSDFGQVFSELEQVSTENVTSSFGGGVRLITTKGFAGRFEVGWSTEETVLRLRADQVFQFAKYGLIHGRDQVALR